MATLSPELRKTLERVILAARGQAEAGARKALAQLAVAHPEPWATMTPDQQRLRRRLRARGRQLGDQLDDQGQQAIQHLVAECAYEHWHRMLFARFLSESGFLMEPVSGVSVSVDECKELARDRGIDWITLAAAFAQRMLPQIFRADDAILEVALPAEHRQPLEQLLISLPIETFLADDSLGWVYQFWQSEEKDRVNESELKIGADEIPAVTQLFTEDYMVAFLLHNTLGAWWAGRRYPKGVRANSEEEARASVVLAGIQWDYLRFTKAENGNWMPAAGVFPAWPPNARDLRVLDPCMGSGHFLVAVLPIILAMRMIEERLSPDEACCSVLRDNLFGLEIDLRCTQIAAFNIALAAWKSSGYRPLPRLHVACSGLSVNAKESSWVDLGGNDERLRTGMTSMHSLFHEAPTLGSLIDPKRLGGNVLEAGFRDLQPLLQQAVAGETDENAHEMAIAAHGLSEAGEILARDFTLVVTNVPYLLRRRFGKELLEFCTKHYAEASNDLATVFLDRLPQFTAPGGTASAVLPQNALFLGSYQRLRERFLESFQWNFVAALGPGAFETIGGEVVSVALLAVTNTSPDPAFAMAVLDGSSQPNPQLKASELRSQTPRLISQASQRQNTDSRIAFHKSEGGQLLAAFATAYQGLVTGDDPRFRRLMWEVSSPSKVWRPLQSTGVKTQLFGGRESLVRWANDGYELARRQGTAAWGKRGVSVRQMGTLAATLYSGDVFDVNAAAIIPHDPDHLAPIWAFCSSDTFEREIRKIDRSIKVTNATLVKVPFDLERWQMIAREMLPCGVPMPQSSDHTQWLFSGHPRGADAPLHVAVARLLGYRWPRQVGFSLADCPSLGPDGLEQFADQDGIVCISPIRGQDSAFARLARMLAAAYGSEWSAATLEGLLTQVDCAGDSLEDWLRDDFFEQHCEKFSGYPFIWQIWDGRRDGFNALVNYHKLTKATLEKLTYAFLGDWINRQEAGVRSGEAGSESRLVAARQLQGELRKILEGEPPYDIFVRWKPLPQQPIGWEPDVNDGVRVNIRPFLSATDLGKKGAGILRVKPGIRWEKDRGKEPARSKVEFPWFWTWDEMTKDFDGGPTFDGNRWNDLHYTREFKLLARKREGLS